MDISTAAATIENTVKKMNLATGETVFDEWAIVTKTATGWRICHYHGPREQAFLAKFKQDIAALKGTLKPNDLHIGDFAFSHEGYGSGFDAHICAGEDLLILFNNTEKSTGEITANPKWTEAQVHFGNLLEGFIADPVVA